MKIKKKIIFVHLYNDISGSPKILKSVIEIAINKKINYHLLTSKHYGFLSSVKNKDYIFFKRSNLKILTFFYYIVSQFFLFFKCLKYKNQNVVFYINTMYPIGAAIAAKLIGKKVIYHIHETSVRPKILKKILIFIINITSSLIINVSNYLNKTIIYKKKQILIDNYSPKIKLKKNKNKNKNFNVLMICSLKIYKGIFEFIQIAKILSKNKEITFSLILNSNFSEIQSFFKKTKLPKNLKIFSKKVKTDFFYKKASLLLNLSHKDKWIETSGLTILESMSHGIPAIVPTIGGPSEIIINNFNGYKISSVDINKISNKILELNSNKKKYLKFCANAITISKRYEFKKFEKKITNILNDIII